MSPRRRSVRTFGAWAVLACCGATSPGILAAQPEAPVEVARAVPARAAETMRLTGSVTAQQRAGLSPRVSGLVAAVHVDAGDRVAKGDVLVELDRTLAELVQRRAEAALEEARTRLAEAERLQNEAAQLVKDRHIPETEGHARAASVRANAAAVARLQAEAREAAEIVARHSVIAPFAGVIARKLTEAGEWVETGTPILELVGTERVRLDVRAPQERFDQIDADTPVAVRLDGQPERTFVGRVAAKVPVTEPGSRTFLVRILVDEASGAMIPGMSAEAVFSIRGDPHAVSVPRDALVRGSADTDRVWVVEQVDGTTVASPRDVRVGRSLAETVEVVDGLDRDVRVVVRGNESLREGQRVRVLEKE